MLLFFVKSGILVKIEKEIKELGVLKDCWFK